MKRITPHTGTEEEHDYPTWNEAKTGRRGFLQQTLGWVAGAGTVWLLDKVVADPTARAGAQKLKKKHGWYQVTVQMPPYPYVQGASYAVCKIIVQTKSLALARFLINKAEQKSIRKAVLPRLKGLTAPDVTDRKKLARLRSRLGKALLKHYKKRTRRRVATPIVTLGLGSRYSCSGRRRPWRTAGVPIRHP